MLIILLAILLLSPLIIFFLTFTVFFIYNIGLDTLNLIENNENI